eukprot:m.143440 g.143440  ORF g.143440 m.143440 type:complete len:117 (+) comp14897_c0_seq3:218-568(+)
MEHVGFVGRKAISSLLKEQFHCSARHSYRFVCSSAKYLSKHEGGGNKAKHKSWKVRSAFGSVGGGNEVYAEDYDPWEQAFTLNSRSKQVPFKVLLSPSFITSTTLRDAQAVSLGPK